MEEALTAFNKRPRSKIHSSYIFSRATDNSVQPVCVVGEPLRVQCTLVNPLSAPLELTDVSLWCTHSPSTTSAPATATSTAAPSPTPISEATSPISAGTTPLTSTAPSPLETAVIPELVLPANSPTNIDLTVVPRAEGLIDIRGLVLNLAPGVRGTREFQVHGKRLNGTMSEKNSVVYNKDMRLKPLVTPPMPQLAVRFVLSDTRVAAGQMVAGTLELANVSSAPLVALTVACSRPEAIVFGDATSPPDLEQLVAATRAGGAHAAPSVISLLKAQGGRLEAQSTVQVPVWLYIATPGAASLHLIFYFEASPAVPKMPYRFLRHSLALTVAPSLQAAVQCLPSSHDVDAHLISLRLENRHPTAVARVDGASLFHSRWAIDSLRTVEPTSSEQAWIPPQTAVTLHIVARRLKASSAADTLSHVSFTNAANAAVLRAQPQADLYCRAAKGQDASPLLLLEWTGMGAAAVSGILTLPLRLTTADGPMGELAIVLRHASHKQHNFSASP
jgi:hypothetical protein